MIQHEVKRWNPKHSRRLLILLSLTVTEVFSWHPHGILFFYLPKAAILSEELGWGLAVYKNNDGVNSNKSPVVAGTWGKEGWRLF